MFRDRFRRCATNLSAESGPVLPEGSDFGVDFTNFNTNEPDQPDLSDDYELS